MNDEPRAEVLLRAVESFLSADVVPRLEGVPRFHARVAANVVAMVAREIETQEDHLRGEWERLGALLGEDAPLPAGREKTLAAVRGRSEALARRIRAGEADAGPWRAEVLAHLRRTVADKMDVSRPPRERAGPKI